MMGLCKSELATRPLLYTDSIKGAQVCRDDMWAVTTEELNRQADRIRELEAELAALRQQQGEPVAWMQDTTAGLYVAEQRDQHHTVPLYREAAPRVPEGWKLVPDVATEEMLRRAEDMLGFNAAFVYQAMLAAAPEPKE